MSDAERTTDRAERAADRPAAFCELFANKEFRALSSASALSWFGDAMARAAVTALVYRETHSVLLAGATFAISYLPWLGPGPVLAALAERYPARRVMVVCDLARMVSMALVAIPGLPVPVMLLLVFGTALLNPPFDAARAALLPRVLDNDRYVLALALQGTTTQATLILGYAAGGTVAAYDPRLALLFDAAPFGISGCAIGLGLHAREPGLPAAARSNLLRETAQGFGLVFGTPALRAIALVVFGSTLFTIVPEGLAAGWAAQLTGSAQQRGWAQGLIMTAAPVGWVVSSLLVGRLVRPSSRRWLIRYATLLAPLTLVPALATPPVVLVVAISGAGGLASGVLIPLANGLFVQALPDGFRARAFGVMQSGVLLSQAAAVLVVGALADRLPLPLVVGCWGLGGVVLMLAVLLTWPSPGRFAEAITAARAGSDRPSPDHPPTADPAAEATAIPAADATAGPAADATAAVPPAQRKRRMPVAR